MSSESSIWLVVPKALSLLDSETALADEVSSRFRRFITSRSCVFGVFSSYSRFLFPLLPTLDFSSLALRAETVSDLM